MDAPAQIPPCHGNKSSSGVSFQAHHSLHPEEVLPPVGRSLDDDDDAIGEIWENYDNKVGVGGRFCAAGETHTKLKLQEQLLCAFVLLCCRS